MNRNLRALDRAAQVLHGLDVVFVGGATVVLHVDTGAQDETRATEDVDCIVAVESRTAFAQLEGELRRRGLRQLLHGDDPICRWRTDDGLVIDVMPAEPGILGFSNRWYSDGLRRAVEVTLPTGRVIRTLPTGYFLGSKVDAFLSRGRADPLASADLEDIVTLLDGVPDLAARVQACAPDLQAHLRAFFADLSVERRLMDWLEGHLPRPVTGARLDSVMACVVSLSGKG